MTAVMTARYIALDPTIADSLREAGGIVYVADSNPGFPCRQCLRDADIGDEMLLVSYDPFRMDSPYRSASPIFIHRDTCTTATVDTPPEQLTRRTLSVRAFDARAMMVDAALVEGTELASAVDRLFADPAVDHLHVHNEPRGCFATRVERVAP